MPEKNRPNVLLLVSDQHHPDIAGFAGDPLADTPHLDALASRGTSLSNAHCAFPLCGPSRMSLMSARHPHEIGCYTNQTQLRSDEPTFAHAFNRSGYDTALAGRMHFSGPDQMHGFRERLLGDVPPTAFLRRTPPSNWKIHEVLGERLWPTTGTHPQMYRDSGPGETGYMAFDRAVTDRSDAWLRRRAEDTDAENPFMLTVGWISPHCPFICEPEDFYHFYERIGEDDLPDPAPHTLHPATQRLRASIHADPPPSLETQRVIRAAYYGLCRFLDRQVGRLMQTLEETGLADNTIVAYTSDHGEQLGEHGLWQKMTFYRGSVGVPMIIAPPRGQTPAVERVTRNVSLSSIGPTLLELVGGEPIPGATLPSFAPLLNEGDEAPWSDEVLAEYSHWGNQVPIQRMVRRGPWKLWYFHGEAPQLFNVEEDPGEFHDRASDPACRELVDELTQRALCGWDPEHHQRERDRYFAGQLLFDDWVERAQPAEPVEPWTRGPLENRVDEIPGSSHRPDPPASS